MASYGTYSAQRVNPPLARSPGAECACKGLGHLENGGTRKQCPHCGGGESRESSLKHTEAYPHRLEASKREERGMVTQPGDRGGTDEFPASENGLIEMLRQHCK
jgi:hypothetical protein